MKKTKFLLMPILFGMFLSGCSNGGNSSPKYASIKIEENQYMTTSLQEGKYELNKAIEFTVNAINEEYRVTSVKFDNSELTPINNGKYSFTPTEEKTYTLTVATSEDKNKIVFTFNGYTKDDYVQKLTRKGVRVNVDNADCDFEDLFKNNNLVFNNNQKLVFLCNEISFGNVRVMIRKIEFTFVDNKNNLEFQVDPTLYSNGVWTSKDTEGDEGDTTLVFNTTGEVVISKIVITTSDYVPGLLTVSFTNLGESEKVYYSNGPTFEDWQNKKPVEADTKFFNGQDFYLYVEWNQYHKDFCDNLSLYYKEESLRIHTFYPSDESGLPKNEITVYEYRPVKEESKTNVINLGWARKEAGEFINIDTTSANKYVKRFMETDPLASLGIIGLKFGDEAKLDLRAKRGYNSLKLIVNEVTVEGDEDSGMFKFTVPFAKPINISFTAKEGDEDLDGKEVIALTGENADKGSLAGVIKDEQLYLTFLADENHPTAKVTSLSFNGAPLQVRIFEDENREYYLLDKDQTRIYTSSSDKSSLFVATITESLTYNSSISFNKGNFKVEITGKTPNEEEIETVYEVGGKSLITVKIIPNQYLDIHSVEFNDRRLKDTEYTYNQEDNSISYTFTATMAKYEFLIQTKTQTVKLELDGESTAGCNIKDLPANPVECGKEIILTLGVTNENDYFLFGKKITVTYNGQEVTVNEENFTFAIVPIKGVTKIKVTITDKA